MELYNPDVEDLKTQLSEVEDDASPDMAVQEAAANTVEPTDEAQKVDISENIGVYWTPEAKKAWRARHRDGSLGERALNVVTFDEIMKR